MTLIVLFFMGLLAGIVNTLAAGGSFIMLPLLIWSGLPATVANGTNRISLLAQNGLATVGFARKGMFDLKTNLRLTVPAIMGSIFGAWMSVNIPDTIFQKVISVLMLVFVALSVYREQKKRTDATDTEAGPVGTFLLFFMVGIYGGFIQAGVGLFLIGSIRFATGFDLVKTNSIKVFIIMCYTVVAITVFALNGKIDWGVAAVVAAGQGLGGFLGAHVAISGGEKWIKRFVFVVLVAMAIKLFMG